MFGEPEQLMAVCAALDETGCRRCEAKIERITDALVTGEDEDSGENDE